MLAAGESRTVNEGVLGVDAGPVEIPVAVDRRDGLPVLRTDPGTDTRLIR